MKHFLTLSIFGCVLIGFPKGIGAQKINSVVPLIDVKEGYLLGGSRGGKWLSAQTTSRFLGSGASYRLFSATKFLGSARASAPKSQGAPCEETLFTKLSSTKLTSGALEKAEFALGGAIQPLRRAVVVQNTNQPIYRAEVEKILRARGISKPIVEITQIWRVDLDGDGAQEVLLTATRKDDFGAPQNIAPASRAGDYSLVLLRKIVRGQVKNILLEGEFYPRAKEFNAPGFYQIAAVFDANGDGKMEVLIRGRYYEGSWASLYEMGGAKAAKVLTEGCGA